MSHATVAEKMPRGGGAANRGGAFAIPLACATFLAQFATDGRYGYFRDELYYIDCARHLAWGYVDQPPLIAFLAWIELHLTGASLHSIRLLPALAGGATAWLAARLARAWGASAWGQALAALAVLAAPGFLMMFHLLTMNAFEPLLWTGVAYLLTRFVQSRRPTAWLWIGCLTGIGMLNKWSMAFFAAAIGIGLLFTPERRAFREKWIWVGAAIAFAIWLPNVIWNVQHHWPFLELMANVRTSGRDVTRAPLPFLLDQMQWLNPLAAPLWIAGAWWLLRGRYRALGITYLLLLAFFIAAGGKNYYLFPIYPLLFAAGGAALDRWLGRGRRLPLQIYGALLLAGGAVLAPMTLPVLSPERFIEYRQALHLTPPQIEHEPNGPLDQQIYADMFGWNEMAREVGRAYAQLPPATREETAIAASNYGEAGAIDFFGPRYGLPQAISGHQSYWLWGPRGYTGASVLLVGEHASRARELCANVDVVGHVDSPYSRSDEHFDIYWCHPLRGSLQTLWPAAKHFN